MRSITLAFITSSVLVTLCVGVRYEPVMDDVGLRSCMPDKKFHRVDASSFMIITKDTQLFGNGTFKFLKDVKAPLKVWFNEICYV